MAKPLSKEAGYDSQEFIGPKTVFNVYSMGSILFETGYRNLPEPAIDTFEAYSRRFMDDRQYVQQDFHAVFRILHADRSLSWAAWQTHLMISMELESLVYVVDTEPAGPKEIGHSELRYSITNQGNNFFHQKPFVGFNETEEEFRRRGYGKRRLIIMNALAQALFKLPLHSSDRQIDGMDNPEYKLWEDLVTEGIAVKTKKPGYPRFVFVQDWKPYLDRLKP